MAEKYYGYSSYTYCLDNPINLIDIKGNEPIRMFIGTAAQFKELLDTSPNRVGGYTGQKAANYLRGLGSTDIKNGRPSPTETGFFNNKVGRYIYTYSGGWIDMAHFMFYAGMAFDNKLNKQEAKSLINSNFFKLLSPEDQIYWQIQSSIDPARKALRSGYLQECIDIITSPVSAFSYEDLPSDRFGADFGANYFDPNSPLSLGEQVFNYLIGVTSVQ